MTKRVNKIIAGITGTEAEDVGHEDNILLDLKFDSLDLLELAMSLENEFNISIPDRDFSRFIIVNDIVEYLEERLSIAA